jgi:predicted ferric reductase
MNFTKRLLLVAAALPSAFAWEPSAADLRAWAQNWDMCKYTAWVWAVIVGIMLVYRWTTELLRHIRRIANLNHGTSSDGRQKYFSIPDEKWARFKKQFIVAPLFRKRHNKEFKLSAALNVGTLPSRAQTFFLLGYFVMNIVTAALHIDWHGDTVTWLGEACDRTGTLAVLNMIPLFLLAGRNNPLIWLLGISFDTYNLIHRWIGRICVIEAALHGAFWMAQTVVEDPGKGWEDVKAAMAAPGMDNMVLTGTIGVCAFIVILLQSPSIIRHAFYETFLHIHILLVILSLVVLWAHLDGLPHQKQLLLPAILCWGIERFARMFLLVRRNIGNGVTKAEVEALPGDAVRITLRIAKPWRFRPGQHVYMYMPSVGLWTSHPFTLAWSQEVDSYAGEKALPASRQDVLGKKAVSMSLIIRRRTGFTDRMWSKAERSPQGKFLTTAFVEGPYGNQSFQSYGTVMLFAAGVGITHQVPHVRDLVAAYANGMCATRKVVLVWIIQSPEHLEWIRPWMTQILSMEKRRDILKILLFITRPRSTKEIHSPSSSVQMFPGKPDVGALIEKEQEKQVGAMAISCCGTGSLSDDLRRAMRERCQRTEMDFFEEAFSW